MLLCQGGGRKGVLYAPALPSPDKLQYVLCLVYDMVRAVGA